MKKPSQTVRSQLEIPQTTQFVYRVSHLDLTGVIHRGKPQRSQGPTWPSELVLELPWTLAAVATFNHIVAVQPTVTRPGSEGLLPFVIESDPRRP
ncbi:MAG: hypothetical protein WBH86_15205 [Thermogutta sp.]